MTVEQTEPEPDPTPDSEPHWVAVDETCRLADMAVTGATYRQLDYWWRNGYLLPAGATQITGSGRQREWTGRMQRIAELMVRLSRTGLQGPLAARMAADSVDHGVRRVTTEDGITVSWTVAR